MRLHPAPLRLARLRAAPLAAALGLVLAAAPALAQPLQIDGPFLRATLPRAPVGGAYLTITNPGPADDRLLAVTAPVGDRVTLHEMAAVDGVMAMRSLPDGVPLPAGDTVSFTPGGLHIIIEGLTEPLVEGGRLDLVLEFAAAGEMTVTFDILAINARSHPEEGQ